MADYRGRIEVKGLVRLVLNSENMVCFARNVLVQG